MRRKSIRVIDIERMLRVVLSIFYVCVKYVVFTKEGIIIFIL